MANEETSTNDKKAASGNEKSFFNALENIITGVTNAFSSLLSSGFIEQIQSNITYQNRGVLAKSTLCLLLTIIAFFCFLYPNGMRGLPFTTDSINSHQGLFLVFILVVTVAFVSLLNIACSIPFACRSLPDEKRRCCINSYAAAS